VKVFIKKLGSNESGYSGDVADQRGKFILIPKGAIQVFPHLSSTILNDNAIMRFRLLSGEEIGSNLVYHNAKFFPSHKRNHDEVRLYRNSTLDSALNLDRNVLVIIVQLNAQLYGIDSVQPHETDYSDIEKFHDSGIQDSQDLETFERIRDIALLEERSPIDISNEGEVIQNAIERYTNARVQQPAAEGDPGAIFSTLINSQDKFSEYIRIAYDKKCALRGISLIENHHIGCDAAHIQPASSNGPLLPTNGFLLSADLHRCFDSGLMSLTDWGEVVVSGNVPGNSELHSYGGKIITPTAGWEAYKPYKEYCKHHRKHIFESRLQSN
jgi:predicted restriction endonuclease